MNPLIKTLFFTLLFLFITAPSFTQVLFGPAEKYFCEGALAQANQSLIFPGAPDVFADINQDGYADYISAQEYKVYVHLNDGNNDFNDVIELSSLSGYSIPSNSKIRSIHVADLNTDGFLDVIFHFEGDATIAGIFSFAQDSSGNFNQLQTHFSTGNGNADNWPWYYGSLRIADFNNDNAPDYLRFQLAGFINYTYYFQNSGTGLFNDVQLFDITYADWDYALYGNVMGTSRGSQAIGDLNMDGYLDIAVREINQFNIYYYDNNNTGFTAPVVISDFDIPSNPPASYIRDFNNDAINDFIGVNASKETLLYLQNTIGSFDASIELSNNTLTTVSDLDNNNLMEVYLANDSGNYGITQQIDGVWTESMFGYHPYVHYKKKFFIEDINNDGLKDLCYSVKDSLICHRQYDYLNLNVTQTDCGLNTGSVNGLIETGNPNSTIYHEFYDVNANLISSGSLTTGNFTFDNLESGNYSLYLEIDQIEFPVQTITIANLSDNEAPVPNQSNLDVLNADCNFDPNIYIPPTATDNCDGLITAELLNVYMTLSSAILEWEYTDVNGNSISQNQDVVIDNGFYFNQPYLDDYTNTCPYLLFSVDYPYIISACQDTLYGNPSESFPIDETTLLEWSYPDGSTQTQQITILPSQGPDPTNNALPMVSEDCQIDYLEAPSAIDLCGNEIIGELNLSLPIDDPLITEVIWTYTDSYGNTSEQTQEISVNIGPGYEFENPNLPEIIQNCQLNYSDLIPPNLIHLCEESIEATIWDFYSFPIINPSITEIIWLYTLPDGTIIEQIQLIDISPDSPPVPYFSNLMDYSSSCTFTLQEAPFAFDACGNYVEGVTDNLVITNLGVNEVIWTFTDVYGNESTQSQFVVINELEPEISFDGTTLSANNTNFDYQWVDCNNNFEAIPGLTNISFAPYQNGSYAVEYEYGGCTGVSNCINVTITDIEESFDQHPIDIYPNPASEYLTIHINNSGKNYTSELYNLEGKVIFNFNVKSGINKINIPSEISKGYYFLKIFNGSNSLFTEKVLIH